MVQDDQCTGLGYLWFRMISVPVKKRFPTLQHLVDAGLLVDNEMDIIEQMDKKAMQVGVV